MPAEGKPDVVRLFHQRHPEFLQPRCLGSEDVWKRQALQDSAHSPQPKCAGEAVGRRSVPFLLHVLAALPRQLIEGGRIELARFDPQRVPAGCRLESGSAYISAQTPPQVGDVAVEILHPGIRWVPVPQPVDQLLGSYGLIGVQQQRSQQQALLPASELARTPAVSVHLQRTKDSELHVSLSRRVTGRTDVNTPNAPRSPHPRIRPFRLEARRPPKSVPGYRRARLHLHSGDPSVERFEDVIHLLLALRTEMEQLNLFVRDCARNGVFGPTRRAQSGGEGHRQ